MITPPIESLFRMFRRTDRDALGPAPTTGVARVSGAPPGQQDARTTATPWPLEPPAGAADGRNDRTSTSDRPQARFAPGSPANAQEAAASAARTATPALLTAATRMSAEGFVQGAREAAVRGPPGGASRADVPQVGARSGEDETAALLAAKSRAPGAVAARVADAYHAPRDATPKISVSGQLVSELLPEPARASSGGTVRAPEPLLAAPTGRPEPIAQALQTSIATSGLFYESHLANWATHRGSLEALAREPQAQWWAATQASAAFTSGAAASDAAQLPAPLENIAALRHLRMQLETLESGRLQWQGELWPRQPAHIAIEAEGWSCGSHDPASVVWRSRLRLEMPHLGTVEAEFVLSGTSLSVRVHPESPMAEMKLRNARDEIAGALLARFAAAAVTVTHAPAE